MKVGQSEPYDPAMIDSRETQCLVRDNFCRLDDADGLSAGQSQYSRQQHMQRIHTNHFCDALHSGRQLKTLPLVYLCGATERSHALGEADNLGDQ
jgi:hypothetical protein